MGSTLWPGFEAFYVARERHFWREDQIKLLEFTSDSELTRAFRNGTIDGGLITLDEALLLAENQQDIRVLLVTDISNGADVILAKPELHRVQDLKGHRIGVETTGLGAYVLTRALELAGLSPKDVEIVPLEFSEQQPAFERGEVDAVVTYEPVSTKLKNAGARQVFDSSLIPGEVVDVLVVRTSYVAASPDNVRLLVESFYRAQRYAGEQSDDFVRFAAARESVTPQQFRRSMALLHVLDAQEGPAMLAGRPSVLEKQMKSLADVMIQENLLRKPVDVASMFGQSPGQRAAP
jgi:NitT/TauT family transport system substrate-binding protein